MSKPLATNVSTHLSENVQLGPISHFLSPVSCDSLVLQVSGVNGEQVC